MTKLTPIEELADKHCSETFNHAFKCEYSYEFTEPQLEALRQAIISDFVKSLEPVGYSWKCQAIGDIRFEQLGVGRIAPSGTIPLFDLSEWKDK